MVNLNTINTIIITINTIILIIAIIYLILKIQQIKKNNPPIIKEEEINKIINEE